MGLESRSGGDSPHKVVMPLKLGKFAGYPAIQDATGETLLVSQKGEREFLRHLIDSANRYPRLMEALREVWPLVHPGDREFAPKASALINEMGA